MANKSKRAKAHHVLPQFYLKAWGTENGLIAMVGRDGKEVRTGSKALAVENDFYTVECPDGGKDAIVEKALAEIDGQGAAAHSAFLRLEFPPEPEQKLAFAQWLGLQWVRGRSSRAGGKELVDKFHKMLIRFGLENAELDPGDAEEGIHPEDKGYEQLRADSGPGIAVPDLSGFTEEERKALAVDLDSFRFEVPRELQLLQMLQMMSPAAMPFLESEWHLLCFEEELLLTSDEPIILQRRPRPENKFLGVGPASADSLYIPLSPSICLAMIRAGSSGRQTVRDLPLAEARKINEAAISTWWTQLFRHVEGPPFPTRLPSLPDERIVVN
jgi:Protein of unknown function (DUF4238)